MGLYARPGRIMAGQVAGDLALLGWTAAWAGAGRWICSAVGQLAAPARQTGNLASQMAGEMEQAQNQVSGVPGIGGSLASPFSSLRNGLGQVQALTDQQVAQVHHVAVVAGWLCFLIPVLVAFCYWVPRRVRFVRNARLTQRFVDAEQDLDLFALRAMANLPMEELARVTTDPVGRWRDGDRGVIEALARKELARQGLELRTTRRR